MPASRDSCGFHSTIAESHDLAKVSVRNLALLDHLAPQQPGVERAGDLSKLETVKPV